MVVYAMNFHTSSEEHNFAFERILQKLKMCTFLVHNNDQQGRRDNFDNLDLMFLTNITLEYLV